MSHRPPDSVVEAFSGSLALEPLSGGEGRCWRSGHLVLKPCDREGEASWVWRSKHLPSVRTEGFRLPLPICSTDGAWVVEGWCAQEWVCGEHSREGRWEEVIRVGELFHEAIRPLPKPSFHGKGGDNPWSIGERVAWEEADPPYFHRYLAELLEMRCPIEAESQFIHGDLTENVLFSPDQPPAIIDLSLYWRPAGFATGVVVADAVCWRNADATALAECASHIDLFPQFYVRAMIFRMVTTLVRSEGQRDLAGYQPGMVLARHLIS